MMYLENSFFQKIYSKNVECNIYVTSDNNIISLSLSNNQDYYHYKFDDSWNKYYINNNIKHHKYISSYTSSIVSERLCRITRPLFSKSYKINN